MYKNSKSPMLDNETYIRFKKEHRKICSENASLKTLIDNLKKIIVNKVNIIEEHTNQIKELEIDEL